MFKHIKSQTINGNQVNVYDNEFYQVTITESITTLKKVEVVGKFKACPTVFFNYSFKTGWVPDIRYPIVKPEHQQNFLKLCHACEITINHLTTFVNEKQENKIKGVVKYAK